MCCGCSYAAFKEDNRCLCPYCRAPQDTSDRETFKRLKKRVEANDAEAINLLGGHYYLGEFGLPQNYGRAMELWLRAGELGCAESYNNIGLAYHRGRGVERDMKKSKFYYELAAMRGNIVARYNLGHIEKDEGNSDRAVKHWMISARAGHDNSLKCIRVGFMRGITTKNDFEEALRGHKEAKDEMKSDQRAEAAALFSQN